MLSTFISAVLAAASLQDGAVATAPHVQPSQPAPPAAASTEAPLPAGAPSDDFGLVAWCHGALRGHLELAEQIKDTLPLDAEQQSLGREYLQTYDAALAAAPQAKTSDGPLRATRANEAGYVRWSPARAALNRQTQTFTYLSWQLPGRCDQAAKRLSSNSDLMGAAIAGAPAAAGARPDVQPAPAADEALVAPIAQPSTTAPSDAPG